MLYRELHPRLARYLRARAPHVAEDLEGEVWLAIAGRLHQFEGDARAAIYLGTTYDPSFLKRARFAKVVLGDRDTAAYWYHRARELGSSDAEALLKTVQK